MEKTNKKATVKPETKPAKRRIKKWPFIVGGIVLVVVIAAILLFSLAKPKANSAFESTSLTESDIVSTVTGTGSLTSADALDIKLPTGLEIIEVLADEGDMVNEGDAIATVNAASVLSLIEDVQAELKTLDTKINKSENETSAKNVQTYVSGRVKAIYAEEGDNAAAVVAEHGSLIVLSIDGSMKLSVEAELPIGTAVTVLLSDNTETEGSVAASENGVSVITFSDAFGTVGEQAAVKDGSGKAIGAGIVSISQPIEIVAPSGTVSDIFVKVNDKVSGGKTLLKLRDVAVSAEHQQYLNEREELLLMLRTLSSLAVDNTLKAPFSGIIGSLYISDNTAVSASAAAASSSSSANSIITNPYAWMSAETAAEPAVTLLTASAEPVTVLNLDDMHFAAPAAGAVPVVLIEIPAYKAEILWAPADAVFAPETVYAAEFKLTANAGFTFPASITPELKDADGNVIPAFITDAKVTGEGEGNVLTFKAAFAPTGKANGSAGGDSAGSGSAGNINNILGSMGGYSGFGSYTSSASSEEDALENAVAFTLAPIDTIHISVNVDELDILSIALGQRATVEVDALEGQTFEGEITDIANNATSGGGTAKYTVSITLPRTESMKNGMSATATIITSEALGVMTIPTEAIQEQGNRVFVYTSIDSEGNFGGEKDIETGLSDGTRTEIISGIDSGDTVYYAATELDPMMQMFNMMMNGAQNMQSGGGRPEMPGGDRPEGGLR